MYKMNGINNHTLAIFEVSTLNRSRQIQKVEVLVFLLVFLALLEKK